jgi:hypothetical protein
VGLIFELAAPQGSGAEIAETLTAKGLTRRNGKPWTQHQVAAVLSRYKRYRDGTLHYGAANGQDANLLLLDGGVDPRPPDRPSGESGSAPAD